LTRNSAAGTYLGPVTRTERSSYYARAGRDGGQGFAGRRDQSLAAAQLRGLTISHADGVKAPYYDQRVSAPIANKGRLNLASLNQIMLGSSAGAKQFLELGTDRNSIRKLNDRGPGDRLSP
jgi:hypothetical protein